MIDRQVATLAVTACLLLALTATTQDAQPSRPKDLRNLEYWAGDIWQRLAELPIAAPVPDGHHVIVKIPKTGNNVEADVYVVSPSSIDPATDSFLHDHFLTDKLAVLTSRFGTRYHTDSDGIVRVSMPKDGVCLAIAGDLIGQRPVQAKRTFVGVHEYAILRAEVVDKDGRPVANMPVRIGHQTPGSQFASGCTDRTGRLVARVPKDTLRKQLLMQAAIAGPERGATIVPDDYFEREPSLLQLKLPRTGSVEVHIDDPVGVLPSRWARATLRWFVDGRPGTHRASPPSAWIDGKAVFAHVAPGMSVEVNVTGTSNTALKAKGDGPTKAGHISELTVAVGAEQLVLRGRLVGMAADGKPVTQGQLRIAGPRRVHHDYFQVGAEQRFVVAIDTAGFNRTKVRFEFFAGTPTGKAPAQVAIAEVGGDRRGVVELGDLPLTTERVLLHGRVLAGNKPIQAHISAPLAHNRDGPDGHRIQTDKDGWFTLYEAAPATGTLPLRIAHGWPPQEHKLMATIGTLEQILELPTGNSLKMTVQDTRFLSLLTYEAIPRAGNGRPSAGHATADGCAFPSLRAVPYDLVIRLGGHLLARVDNVDASNDKADPRCQNLAWQSELKSKTLHITDATGKPLRAHCYVATGGNQNSLWAISDADGHVELPYADGHTFFVRHGRYRGMVVQPADGVLEVRMLTRATVRLRLPEGLTLPGDVEMRFSSELQQFGLQEHVHNWRPNQPNSLRPEAQNRTVLRVVARHLDRSEAVLHEQTILLPKVGGAIEVLVGIDEDDAGFAADLAAARVRRK